MSFISEQAFTALCLRHVRLESRGRSDLQIGQPMVKGFALHNGLFGQWKKCTRNHPSMSVLHTHRPTAGNGRMRAQSC